MKQAAGTHHELWAAYGEALREAQANFREAEETGANLNALGTIEGRELLRQKLARANGAFDFWRRAADELYKGMGVARPWQSGAPLAPATQSRLAS